MNRAAPAIRWWTGLLLLCLPILATAQEATPQTLPDDYVLVRRVIDTRYAGTQKQAAEPPAPPAALPLDLALNSQLMRPATVRPRDTMQELVYREYGVSVNSARAAYDSLEDAILRNNGLDGPAALVAGAQLQIPALPAGGTRPSGTDNKGLAQLPNADPGLLLPKDQEIRIDDYAVQFVWMRRKDALAEQIRVGDRGRAVSILAEQLPIRLGEAGPTGDGQNDKFPNAAERKTLASALSRPAAHPSVLIILDQGWPDEASYAATLAWLKQAADLIEPRFNYPFARQIRGLKAPGALASAEHTRHIAESLQSLRELEAGQQRVQVIYLPLTTLQQQARPVLEDLITLRLLDSEWRARRDDAPTKKMVNSLRKVAADTLARLPPPAAQSGDLITDRKVVEAVVWLANLYAEASGNPYVINFSWTMPPIASQYADMRFNRGLVVAAAGNASSDTCTACRPHLGSETVCDCADRVVDQGRWFAVRSVDGQDVIGVMNTARNGSLQCRSSIITTRTKKIPAAVSFDGAIAPDVCGTSFAAPRVAWLAAARLAYVDMSRLYAGEADRGQQLRDFLLDARIGPDQASPDRFNLDIAKLFPNQEQYP